MPDDVFAAIANPVRRQVMELLLQGPRPAGQIAAAFELSRPAVSEHLQVLRKAGLVRETPKGRERRYSINPEGLLAVSRWVHPFEAYWRARIDSLAATLNDTESGSEKP